MVLPPSAQNPLGYQPCPATFFRTVILMLILTLVPIAPACA